MKKAFLLVLLIIAGTFFLSAQDFTVSVIPLNTSSGISDSELKVVTEYLESGLINTGLFEVIASDQRDTILGEQAFSLGGCVDQSCALEIGRMLSAQYMVFGSVNKQGNSYILSVKRVNVETSKIDANAIDTLMTLSPGQIEKTTLKLAYQLAGLSYTAEEESIASYTGSVRLRVSPSGARALFNLATEVTDFPDTIDDIPVGEYPVRVSLEGYETELLSVRVEKGKTAEVNVTLKKESGPAVKPPTGQGFLTIYSSPPGMQVEVDYEILDVETPVENLPLDEGEHFVVVGDFYNSYYQDRETYVTVEAGKTVELPVELERNNGTLLVNCPVEDAAVYVNGKKEGTVKGGRALVRNIPAGRIELTVTRDRYNPDTRELDLRPGQTTEVSVEITPMPVRVVIDSNPAGAEVFFDDKSIGKTPTLVEDVKQGEHSYYLVYNGYTTDKRSLQVTGTDDRTIIEDLAAPLTVTLSDATDREAEVYVDGHYAGETSGGTLRVEGVAYGSHSVELRKDGYGTVTKTVTVPEAGYRLSADLKLEDISFSVITEPGGAEVLVDGRLLEGETPMTIRLSEGRHEVTLRKKGYLPVSETVVVDSPRGMRIKKSLVEGEDAEVLMAYYRGEVERLEGALDGTEEALRMFMAGIEDLEAELDSYDMDTSDILTFLNSRAGDAADDFIRAAVAALKNPNAGMLSCRLNIEELEKLRDLGSRYGMNSLTVKILDREIRFYRDRYASLDEESETLRSRIEELQAEKAALEKRKTGLLWGEVGSVAGALGTGAGAYFAYQGMIANHALYEDAGLTADAERYRTVSQALGWLSYAAIGAAVTGVVTAVVLPGKISAARAGVEDASDKLSSLAGALAKIEMTWNAEGDVPEDVIEFVSFMNRKPVAKDSEPSTPENMFLLSWNDVEGAVNYEVEFALSEIALDSSGAISVDSSRYQIPDTDTFSIGETCYWRVRGINNEGFAGLWSDVFTLKIKPQIGSIYAGGIVFYLDGKGSGLVCAESDQSTANIGWGIYGRTVAGTSTDVGTGAANTTAIVNATGTRRTYAARLCYDLSLNGYKDWFLPSKDELDLMYANLYLQGLGAFGSDYYWSSSEDNSSDAWWQYFGNGLQYKVAKISSNGRVRAVRAFSY